MNSIKNHIVVSVLMITYCHDNFIEEAINGVLMQVCDFDIQLILADDCSPDKTESVVNRIIREHPNGSWIKYKRHIENKGPVGNGIWALDQAKGKYIALCEGDDYWTDPLKLQKQVDFFEANADFAICGSLARRTYDNLSFQEDVEGEAGEFEQKDLAQRNFIPSASLLIKREHTIDLPCWFYDCPICDWPLLLICSNHGKIKIFEEQMVLRHVHAGGIWGGNIIGQNNDKNILTLISMFDVIRDKFSPDINDILNNNYLKQLIKLIEYYFKQQRFDEVGQYLQVLLNEERNISEEVENITKVFTKKMTLQEQEINNLKMLNNQLINSNSYKLGRQITGVFSFLKKK
ncbi:MAG: glycosyltransferase involved in cell wall biosynthesis [Psychroserpens sp.]|jgi:glycosyltransferase involved in cell wall biosynthesis